MRAHLIRQLLQHRRDVWTGIRRNVGMTAVVLQKSTDPIQQMYLSKIQAYAKKSKAAGGKLVDATPQFEHQLTEEKDRIKRMYGGGDMLNLPSFQFKDVDFDKHFK